MTSSRFQSVFRAGLFDGQVVVVTGGGTGIGRCIAHEVAALGGAVVLMGRREQLLADTAREIADAGGLADHVVADIRREEDVDAAVAEVTGRHGRISALVNNAGGQFPSAAEKLSANGWRSVVDLNLTGTFLMSQAVYEASLAEHGGGIVSIVAPVRNGFPLFAHSGAARAGVINLTRTLAVEWAARGVRVNAVAPGIILSGGVEGYPEAQQKLLVQRSRRTPAGRLGTESEVSAAVVFLLSPAAAFLTGETLVVDGGGTLEEDPRTRGPEVRIPVPFDGFQQARATPPSWAQL